MRIRILELLQNQELNVTEIAKRLAIPPHAATSILALEEAGLINSHSANGVKGGRKVCGARYKEFIISFSPPSLPVNQNMIEVEMPVGLFTSHNVSVPYGLCSRDGILASPDVPSAFFAPTKVSRISGKGSTSRRTVSRSRRKGSRSRRKGSMTSEAPCRIIGEIRGSFRRYLQQGEDPKE
ncbi:MAG: ArsR family transcriptional regulator [Treponema sp.]|nr:ArsR family transcriptional regulator [Treponema sp.]